jgi:hypothetical protein
VPYIAFELDAIHRVPHVATAAGVEPARVSHGLLQLWEYCWREKQDKVTATHLRGFFACECTDALLAFGFLESAESGFRVKGASRYLRLEEGRKKGGQASKGNLIPGPKPKRAAEGEPKGGAEGEPKGSRRAAEGEPKDFFGSPSALTASSEQRAANSELKKGEKPPCAVAAAGGLSAPKAILAGAQPDKRAMPRPGPDNLRDRLEGVFQRVKTKRYSWRTVDDNACRELLHLAEDSWVEIEERWDKGLRHVRYPTCNSLVELVKHWNAYATDEPSMVAARDPHKAPVRAEDVNRELFAKSGDVTHEF